MRCKDSFPAANVRNEFYPGDPQWEKLRQCDECKRKYLYPLVRDSGERGKRKCRICRYGSVEAAHQSFLEFLRSLSPN